MQQHMVGLYARFADDRQVRKIVASESRFQTTIAQSTRTHELRAVSSHCVGDSFP